MKKYISYSSLLLLSFLFCQCSNDLSFDELKNWHHIYKNTRYNVKVIEYQVTEEIVAVEELSKTKLQFRPMCELLKELLYEKHPSRKWVSGIKDSLIAVSGGQYTEEEARAIGDTLLAFIPKSRNGRNVLSAWVTNRNDSLKNQLMTFHNGFKELILESLDSLWAQIDDDVFNDEAYHQEVRQRFEQEIQLTKLSHTWFEEHLAGQAVPQALVALSAVEIESLQAILQLATFCKQNIGRYKDPYDHTDFIMYMAKPYWQKGDTIRAEIFPINYSKDYYPNFKCIVNGDTLENRNGQFIYKTIPKSTGKKVFVAEFSIFNLLTGEEENFTKEFEYEVLAPQNR